MKVEVYWNLNKHVYSVRALEGESKGRVIAHEPEVNLVDVRLVVRASGQRRARQEGHRNVHAFARGYLCSPATPIGAGNQGDHGQITYNPFTDDSFVWRSPQRTPVHHCAAMMMSIDGETGRPDVRGYLCADDHADNKEGERDSHESGQQVLAL